MHSPSPALALWLEDFGVTSAGLHPEEAAGWLATWERQQRAHIAGRLPRRVAGPGAARDFPGRARTSARRLFRPRRHRGLRLVGPTGRLHSKPREVEEALWESRRNIWATRPEASAAGPPLMHNYFQERRTRIPGARPRWGTMLALVLEPKGSAP